MPAGQDIIEYEDKNQNKELNNNIEDTNKELLFKYLRVAFVDNFSTFKNYFFIVCFCLYKD